METSDVYLYFERQTAALCGVHALNTLLQGPYFSEVELAEIAHKLDAMERQLMEESGMDGADFLRYAAEESGNVDASGMFSIQVLSKALEVWDLAALPFTSPAAAVAAARAEPQNERAFICNLQEHWFTIRRVAGEWYNFNSLFNAPEPLSPFYLAAFLASLQEQGYTIFVVKGPLPAQPHPEAGTIGGHGSWFSPAEARAAAESTQQLKKSGFLQAAARGAWGMASAGGTRMSLRSSAGTKRGHDGGDADLERALAASRAEAFGGSGAGSDGGGGSQAADFLDDDEEDSDLAAAIAASWQPNPAPTAPEAAAPPSAAAAEGGDAAAAAQPVPALPELEEAPAAGEGVIEVAVRLPSGQRYSRRFAGGDTVGHVAAFAASHGVDMAKHRLATSFPRAVLSEWGQGLREAKVGNKQVFTVEPR